VESETLRRLADNSLHAAGGVDEVGLLEGGRDLLARAGRDRGEGHGTAALTGVGAAAFRDVRRRERDGPAHRASEQIDSGDGDLVVAGSHACTDDLTELDRLAIEQVAPAGGQCAVADLDVELLG